MEWRQSWLFPLMVAAAGAVTVLGGLGIAAILGLLPLSRSDAAAEPTGAAPAYYDALERSSARLVAQVGLVEAQTAKAIQSGRQPDRPVR